MFGGTEGCEDLELKIKGSKLKSEKLVIQGWFIDDGKYYVWFISTRGPRFRVASRAVIVYEFAFIFRV